MGWDGGGWGGEGEEVRWGRGGAAETLPTGDAAEALSKWLGEREDQQHGHSRGWGGEGILMSCMAVVGGVGRGR